MYDNEAPMLLSSNRAALARVLYYTATSGHSFIGRRGRENIKTGVYVYMYTFVHICVYVCVFRTVKIGV